MNAFRTTSLRSRLTRALVGLGLVSVILLATVNFFVVRGLLDSSTRTQLEALRDSRADAVELAINRLLVRAAVFGIDPGVGDAFVDLDAGYRALDDSAAAELDDAQLEQVAEVYDPVVRPYDEAGVDRPSVDELLPTSAAGRYLQYRYIASNDADDRSDLADGGGDTEYDTAHARHHAFLNGLAKSIGASDLLFVDVDDGEIVYSASKFVDLGTNAFDGPYSTAGLGIAVGKLDGSAVDSAVLADTSFYLPNSAAPVVHVAVAVRNDAEVVGALVLVLRTERLTDIVTASQQWDALGLGETGDAYIVGTDRRLRTVPRQWFGGADAYIERFRDVTGDDRAAGLIEFAGSPVLIHEVDNDAVAAALDGEPFVGRVDNPLDRSTIAAATPLAVSDLGWVLVTEQQTSETGDELMRFVVAILVVLAILLALLVVIGLVLARMLAKPVRPLVEAAARIADGDYDTKLPDLGRNELGDVGRQLDAVATRLHEQEQAIEDEEARINRMLATVLPDSLVERVRSGERELAEVVDTATVISISIRGMPAPSGADQDSVLELTTRLGSEIGRLAAEHGVERAQVALEHQLFVAGRGRADTDAAAAATFAEAVLIAVGEIGTDHGLALTARAGLAAGLVATGVLGSRQVSFTLWGTPVTTAAQLSSRAADGVVLADSVVVDELSDAWSVDPDESGAYQITTTAPSTP